MLLLLKVSFIDFQHKDILKQQFESDFVDFFWVKYPKKLYL